jgi:hypothetical protein
MAIFSQRKVLVSLTTGVFLLLVLVGAWILRFERRARAPGVLAVRTARNSAKIRELLGEPLHVARLTKGTLVSNRGDGNADLIIQIEGPLGRGMLYEWAQEGAGKWHICSLLFESSDGSTSIPLVNDSFTHCERE